MAGGIKYEGGGASGRGQGGGWEGMGVGREEEGSAGQGKWRCSRHSNLANFNFTKLKLGSARP